MKIALDVHGGDFGIRPNIEGAVRALADTDISVILVGDEAAIKSELVLLNAAGDPRIEVAHASQVADMAAEPVQECRDKPDCSVMVCAKLVKEGKAHALVSAGNSGATMVASFLKMGRIKGISRPAIAIPMPTVKGVSVLLDGGANTECRPQHLVEFALMGSVYAEHVLGIKNPTIGVLSVGEEETKGNTLVKEVIPLLKKSGLNYTAPVEGRDVHFGTTDVVVCDGFVGNIVLKVSEGLSKAIFELIRQEIKASLFYQLGAFMAQPAFRAIKHRTDPDRQGGAPLLGVDGTAVICHGRSSHIAMYYALKTAAKLVSSNANDIIAAKAEEIKDLLASPEEAAAA